jgi:hypothetical protein
VKELTSDLAGSPKTALAPHYVPVCNIIESQVRLEEKKNTYTELIFIKPDLKKD